MLRALVSRGPEEPPPSWTPRGDPGLSHLGPHRPTAFCPSRIHSFIHSSDVLPPGCAAPVPPTQAVGANAALEFRSPGKKAQGTRGGNTGQGTCRKGERGVAWVGVAWRGTLSTT